MADGSADFKPAPSFEGRLNLCRFLCSSSSVADRARPCPKQESIRSSPRLPPGPATVSSHPATPAKRKAPSRPELDDAAPLARAMKKNRIQGYQPPSVYAHLPQHLPDALAPGLLVLFVGINPGLQTAVFGHAYAHPSNLFWKLLQSSGITDRRCAASEDADMPRLYSLGLTNLVTRPSRSGAELCKDELDAGVGALEAKAGRWRPETVCVVGKSIWESVWRVRHKRAMGRREFSYGWQGEEENLGRGRPAVGDEAEGVAYTSPWGGARVYVATSTSGLAAAMRPAEKERIWRELGVWVIKRREERAAKHAEEHSVDDRARDFKEA